MNKETAKFTFEVGTFLILVGGALFFLSDRYDWFAHKPPRLVSVPPALQAEEPDDHHPIPFGRGLPTSVVLRNGGEKGTLIQAVKFHKFTLIDTPKRQDLCGAGTVVTVPVNFEQRHFAKDGASCTVLFTNPRSASGGDYIDLQLSITRPDWKNKTCVGSVTITYADSKEPHTVNNVEIDVQTARRPQRQAKAK